MEDIVGGDNSREGIDGMEDVLEIPSQWVAGPLEEEELTVFFEEEPMILFSKY